MWGRDMYVVVGDGDVGWRRGRHGVSIEDMLDLCCIFIWLYIGMYMYIVCNVYMLYRIWPVYNKYSKNWQ